MSKTITAIVATAGIAAAALATPKPAEARCLGCWIGAGIAAGVIGGALASQAYGYGYGYGYDPAALEMDEKQHIVGHQPAQREHLRGEEVGPDQQRQVDPDECRPGCRALALRCGRQTMTLQDVADRKEINAVQIRVALSCSRRCRRVTPYH